MKRVAQIVIVALSVAEGAVITFFTSSLKSLGNAFGGSGDGAGSHGNPNGEMLVVLISAVVWLILTSPYLCMAAGALGLISDRSLRITYFYSLVALVLMTLFEVRIFHRPFMFMALGNIVAGGLWAYFFRKTAVRP